MVVNSELIIIAKSASRLVTRVFRPRKSSGTTIPLEVLVEEAVAREEAKDEKLVIIQCAYSAIDSVSTIFPGRTVNDRTVRLEEREKEGEEGGRV